ncbi:hypothetical protein ACFQX7_38770 [Luedemannella flava]
MPAALATRLWPRAADSRVDLRGDPGAGGELHVFTDREAVMRASGPPHGVPPGRAGRPAVRVPGRAAHRPVGQPVVAARAPVVGLRRGVRRGAQLGGRGAHRADADRLAPSDRRPCRRCGATRYQVLHSHVTGEPRCWTCRPGRPGRARVHRPRPGLGVLDRLGRPAPTRTWSPPTAPARSHRSGHRRHGIRAESRLAAAVHPPLRHRGGRRRADIDAAPPRLAAPTTLSPTAGLGHQATGEVTRAG